MIDHLEVPRYHESMGRKRMKHRPAQGAKPAEFRRRVGLSQAELARLVGEPQPNIAFCELSAKPPRESVLSRLAKVLDVRVEHFLSIDKPPARRGGPVGKVRELFDTVAQLPRSHQRKAVEVLTALVNQHRHQAAA